MRKDAASLLDVRANSVSFGRPRYLVIPLEDVEFTNSAAAQSFPVYRMPELARQARAAQEEERPAEPEEPKTQLIMTVDKNIVDMQMASPLCGCDNALGRSS